jgi:hypothetical protein
VLHLSAPAGCMDNPTKSCLPSLLVKNGQR